MDVRGELGDGVVEGVVLSEVGGQRSGTGWVVARFIEGEQGMYIAVIEKAKGG